jgi:hypothetical protein
MQAVGAGVFIEWVSLSVRSKMNDDNDNDG